MKQSSIPSRGDPKAGLLEDRQSMEEKQVWRRLGDARWSVMKQQEL
jgi:hypothetical protein